MDLPIPMRACTRTALLLAALHAGGTPTDAQIRGSEASTVSQTIDGTTLTLAYSRPTARGRHLFGGVVPWNSTWTPGANWATTFVADRDVKLNGVPVPAGSYSMWMIPRDGTWTLSLDRRAKLFHFQKPDSTDTQIHVPVTPEAAGHVEILTWSFPVVAGDAALLAMEWGETRVPLEVLVRPSDPTVLPAEERALYVGRYALSILDGIGYPTRAVLEVTEHNGTLRGRLPFPIHPGDELEFDLVPAGLNRFSPGLYHDGELFKVEMGVSFEFQVDERAHGVVMRGIEGTPFGQGSLTADGGGGTHPPEG